MNLTRLCQAQGFGTRRACRGLIAAGYVAVTGEFILDPESEVSAEGLSFSVEGKGR